MIQHQNTAPAPPTAIAVEIPIIFPVPIVAANAVASAEYEVLFSRKTKPDPTWDLTLDKPQTKCKIQMCPQKKQDLPRGSKLTDFCIAH